MYGLLEGNREKDENLKFFRVFDNDGNNEFLRSPEETEKSEWLKRTTSLR